MRKWILSNNFLANLPPKWKFFLLALPLLLVMEIATTIAAAYLLTSNESLAQIRNHLYAITLIISLFGIASLLLMLSLISKPMAEQTTPKGPEESAVDNSSSQLDETESHHLTGEMPAKQMSGVAAEQAYRDGARLYRSLLDNIDLGVTMISKDFEVIIANAKQGRLLNRPPESFTGRKCHMEFEKREEVCPHCPGRKAMQSGKGEEVETTGIRDDGTTINVRIKAFPLRNEQQEITGFIEIVTDISNQRHLEEELQRIKSIESIGLLAGGLAHDFNNLLTTIIGNIDLALLGADPQQDFVVRLNAAGKACEQARRLTNQLLTFAKGGQPVKKKVHLPQILDEACHFTLSGSSLRYILDAPANLWPVEIDPSQMSQAIHNLLNNAREAMAANPTGKIFVLAENLQLDASSPLPLPPGPYVKLAIVDEGRGIHPEILRAIFNPYFTTKELGANKGTGLGLTICHSIIHKHGGHISAESTEGQGATFTIYLPALGAPPARHQAPPTEADSPTVRPSLHVLILEDEEAVAHIITSFLIGLHHHSEVASNGAEAIKLLQQAQAKNSPYDLFILDLTIRGGMGGEEVLHKLRAMAPTVPAIVTSGYTEDPIMANHQKYGFQAAMAKPFNQATLRETINTATNRPVAPPPDKL